MDENRLYDKLDKIDERLNSVDKTLSAQHVSLEDHIRRTNILEEELKPIKRHVSMVDGAAKLIALAGIVAAIVEAVHVVFK